MIFYYVQAVQAVLHVYILFLPILYSLQNNKSLLIIKFMVLFKINKNNCRIIRVA